MYIGQLINKWNNNPNIRIYILLLLVRKCSTFVDNRTNLLDNNVPCKRALIAEDNDESVCCDEYEISHSMSITIRMNQCHDVVELQEAPMRSVLE